MHKCPDTNDVSVDTADLSSQNTRFEGPHGYFYLLREREFLMRNEDVYKVGITLRPNPHARLNQYKKGSEVILIWQLPSHHLTKQFEDDMKVIMGRRFKRHIDGHEYFEGDKGEILRCILDLLHSRKFEVTPAWVDSNGDPYRYFVDTHLVKDDDSKVHYADLRQRWRDDPNLDYRRDISRDDMKVGLSSAVNAPLKDNYKDTSDNNFFKGWKLREPCRIRFLAQVDDGFLRLRKIVH